MRKTLPAASPEAYVAALDGWRLALVSRLRAIALEPAQVEERIRWGHLVYSVNGPAYLIRAEDARVLLGFWRGQRLRDIDSRLKPGGKYEMATMELREDDRISPETVRGLVAAAIGLNVVQGDPTALAKPTGKSRQR